VIRASKRAFLLVKWAYRVAFDTPDAREIASMLAFA
jgi:hypothetical protein